MLYIVTPLSRVENFNLLYKSISNYIPLWKASKKIAWYVLLDGKLDELDKFFCKERVLGSQSIKVIKSPISNSFVGHSHRNYFLNEMYSKKHIMYQHWSQSKKADWVYFLDDDTLLHPDFLETIIPLLESNSDKAAIIFDQENKDGSMRLFANINQVKVCHIDMGQYIVNLKKLPSDLRFKEDDYCADGIFIEELFNRVGPEQFLVVNKTLSTYNKLR